MTSPSSAKLSFTFDLPHPPEKIWRALTEPALLAKWLMSTDMHAVLGNKFTFKTQPTQGWNGVVDCEILELEPDKRLRYTWKAPPLETVVTWTLTPIPSGTRLELEHAGFATESTPFFEGAKKGWPWMVSKLEKALVA